jgi:copper transport protein
MPADGAALAAAPQTVMLHFTEAVKLTMLSIRQNDGEKRGLGPLPAKADVMFTVATPGLATGRYTVSWRALSADTHVMSGEFAFSVGTAGPDGHSATPSTDHAPHAEHAPAAHGEHR